MAPRITYDAFKPGEEEEVINLVLDVFDEHVAPTLSGEGITEFKKYADATALHERLGSSSFVLTARSDGRLLGMIEVRQHQHIAFLFVRRDCQRQGIGRNLIFKAIGICREKDRDMREITVNSSLNAVDAYAKIGFHAKDGEQEGNGIRFVPMGYPLEKE